MPEATPTPRDLTPAEDVPAPTPLRPPAITDDPPRSEPHSNLARGIVWADILAEIAAEAEVRDLREAA